MPAIRAAGESGDSGITGIAVSPPLSFLPRNCAGGTGRDLPGLPSLCKTALSDTGTGLQAVR